MPMLPTEFGSSVPVDGFGPGFFRVGGAVHHGPLIVLESGPLYWGGLDDRAALLALAGKADLLFLGMGKDIAHPPKGLIEALAQVGIRAEPMATPAAARSYNVLLSEGRRVAAALLPV